MQHARESNTPALIIRPTLMSTSPNEIAAGICICAVPVEYHSFDVAAAAAAAVERATPWQLRRAAWTTRYISDKGNGVVARELRSTSKYIINPGARLKLNSHWISGSRLQRERARYERTFEKTTSRSKLHRGKASRGRGEIFRFVFSSRQ